MQQAISTQSIMVDFAASTGLSDTSREPRRYLWTDAYAVCNYLELYRHTNDQIFLQLALKLVDQVHQILGRQRKDSVHSGWLSGLDGEQAQLITSCWLPVCHRMGICNYKMHLSISGIHSYGSLANATLSLVSLCAIFHSSLNRKSTRHNRSPLYFLFQIGAPL